MFKSILSSPNSQTWGDRVAKEKKAFAITYGLWWSHKGAVMEELNESKKLVFNLWTYPPSSTQSSQLLGGKITLDSIYLQAS